MEECYEGIIALPQIQAPCGGNFTSTDCVQTPIANLTLNLASGATQTQINNALTTALVYKQQQIEELIARIVVLETA
jgi:hypothetical protein